MNFVRVLSLPGVQKWNDWQIQELKRIESVGAGEDYTLEIDMDPPQSRDTAIGYQLSCAGMANGSRFLYVHPYNN